MVNINSDSKQRLKTFWQRPEGKFGAIFLVLIGILMVIFSVPILTFMISMLENVITAVIMFMVLGALLYVLFDPKFRNLIWYMYKSFMRWVTSVFVQIDPIKILETYIEHLYNNLRQMDIHIAKLKGQVSKLKGTIDENVKEMEQSLKIAEAAKKKNDMELVAINTRQYGRLKESNEKYNVLLSKMDLLYKVFSKIYKNSNYLIKDTENEVRMRKQEYIAIKAGHSAMKRAINIIQGDPDKKMMFDMATEAVVEDVHNKIGEMERFIELSGSFIDSIDLQNGIYEQEGLELLEKMEKEGASMLLGEPVELPHSDDTDEIAVEKEIGSISKYDNLFD